VVELLDPEHNLIDGVLSRNDCLFYRSKYIKNLFRINRDIKNLIIIDVIRMDR